MRRDTPQSIIGAVRDAGLDRTMVTFDFRRTTTIDFGKSVRSNTAGRAIA